VISVFGAHAGQAEVDALAPSVLGGWMGMGPRVAEFEQAIEARVGA
jgi:dTDP-4-amino-4,6-dideoxygalactose transaminase